MSALIKLVFFAIFAAVIFGRSYITSDFLYWSLYILMGGLLIVLWQVMFKVSEKTAVKVLGKEPDFNIFAGKIPLDVRADLDRGRLCVTDGKLVLIQKKEREYLQTWEMPIENIKSVGFGKVGGSYRYGFTLHCADRDTEFVCSAIKKQKDAFFKALGWK